MYWSFIFYFMFQSSLFQWVCSTICKCTTRRVLIENSLLHPRSTFRRRMATNGTTNTTNNNNITTTCRLSRIRLIIRQINTTLMLTGAVNPLPWSHEPCLAVLPQGNNRTKGLSNRTGEIPICSLLPLLRNSCSMPLKNPGKNKIPTKELPFRKS